MNALKEKINAIEEFVISEEHRKVLSDGTFAGAYIAYWDLVKKFGLNGVHYLERSEHTNPIKGIKKEAAFLVAREWRDRRAICHQYLSAGLAILSAVVAIISASAALVAIYG